MPFQKGHKLSGSRKGKPNKVTAQAREAIGLFVEGNVSRLQGWLDQIAKGEWTEPDAEGNRECLISPDPKRAFELFTSIIEYHVPKLTRTEGKVDHEHRGRLVISDE